MPYCYFMWPSQTKLNDLLVLYDGEFKLTSCQRRTSAPLKISHASAQLKISHRMYVQSLNLTVVLEAHAGGDKNPNQFAELVPLINMV